jgi:hypothetical protein
MAAGEHDAEYVKPVGHDPESPAIGLQTGPEPLPHAGRTQIWFAPQVPQAVGPASEGGTTTLASRTGQGVAGQAPDTQNPPPLQSAQ